MKKYIYLLIIGIIVITGCNNDKLFPDIIEEKELVCTKDITTSDIPMLQTVNIKFMNNKIETMNTNILVTLSNVYKSSIDTFVKSFEKTYADQYKDNSHIQVDVSKKSESEIFINIEIDYKNMTNEEKVSSKLTGSEDYSVNKMQFESKGYTCK